MSSGTFVNEDIQVFQNNGGFGSRNRRRVLIQQITMAFTGLRPVEARKTETRRPQLRCNALLCFTYFMNGCISAIDRFVVAAEQSMLRKTLIWRTSFNSFLKHNGQHCESQSVKSCLRFQDGRLIVMMVSNHFANDVLFSFTTRRAMEWTHHKLIHDDLFCRHCCSQATVRDAIATHQFAFPDLGSTSPKPEDKSSHLKHRCTEQHCTFTTLFDR